MTYYLYKKTHKITGLRYLGKTTRDPFLYKGSGKRWIAHLEKHGYDVDTEIIAECQSNDEIKEMGEYYSLLWDIVEDTNWANLKAESGDGGDTSMTANWQKKLPEVVAAAKRRKWWNNGVDSVHAELPPDDSWVRGRIRKSDNSHNTGKFLWNNGTDQVMSKKCPGEGWVKGMLLPEGVRQWTDGTSNVRSVDCPGEGWRLGLTKRFGGYVPSAKGLKWWNNGVDKMYVSECPGDGWKLGRGSWWNNGIDNILSLTNPGSGWKKGRLKSYK